MIKATATINGRPTLLLGLSFGNLDKFREAPGDTYVHIDGKTLNLPIDVMIYSGETEADCAKTLKGYKWVGTRE